MQPGFVQPGAKLPLYSHTLDLSGAALATSNICSGIGDTAGAAVYLKLAGFFKNVIDTKTGLMDQKSVRASRLNGGMIPALSPFS